MLISLTIIKADTNFTEIIDILGQIEENCVNIGGTRVPSDISKEAIFVFRDFRSTHLKFVDIFLCKGNTMHVYCT
jgi:hypothetical protein